MPTPGRESVAEKLADPWRMTCPEGHANLRDKKGPTVFCESCAHAYRYADLLDRKALDAGPDRREPGA